MLESHQAEDMGLWLSNVRERFSSTAPDLLSIFEIYAAEALFGRSYLADDLASLKAGAQILEVGAGSLLLSCQLVREGYQITALEPIGSGFSHFDRMRMVVLSTAREHKCCPPIVELPGEKFSAPRKFDYAFSVNVMEHVENVATVIKAVSRNLTVGGTYRFTCANYLFPYEPHFNIPTFFSKRLTEKLLGHRIFNNQSVPDPVGTWTSLNWITVSQVSQYVGKLPWVSVSFNRNILFSTLERVVTDENFASRRSALVSSFLKAIVKLRLHYLLKLAPARFQPLMDCQICRIADEVLMNDANN